VKFHQKCRYRPGVEILDTRELLSGVSASLSRRVLTISRSDAAQPIQIDLLPPPAGVRGRAAHRTIAVLGAGSFNANQVRVVRINPGSSRDNIVVHAPRRMPIPIRINATVAQRGGPPSANLVPTSTPIPTPSTTAMAEATVPGVTGVESELEQQVFDLVNAERAKARLAPLTLNPRLVTAAQIHARDMAALGVMDHDLSGVAQPSLVSRARYVGYKYNWLGENIASNYPDAASVVAAWMASSGHRANILNPNLTDGGIGVGRDAQGVLYFCQEFASPGPN
jgi:uncharacterized protein YkwD